MTARAVRYQNRLREQGLCPHCRQPTELNPMSGNRYHYCQTERERRRLAAQARRQKRK